MLLTRSPLGHPPKEGLARLACVKHAASVRPEPGSNSPLNAYNMHQTEQITSKNQTNTNTKQNMALTFRHTVEFSKNKHTPSRTTEAVASSGVTYSDLPGTEPVNLARGAVRSRRLMKLTSPPSHRSPRPVLTSRRYQCSARFVRSPVGRGESYADRTVEVKSACREGQASRWTRRRRAQRETPQKIAKRARQGVAH